MGWRWRHRHRGRPPLPVFISFEYDVQQLIPVPIKNAEPIVLTKEELEALRLVDYEGLTQEQAAEKMKVSRSKVSRLVNSARKKIIQAIIEGRPIKII